MPLFFVKHEHDAEKCPAKDPNMGNMLLSHISPVNAQKYGVELHSDAVLDGLHTLVLILDAQGKKQVEKFMQPFYQAGPVEIHPASYCETVVERAGC